MTKKLGIVMVSFVVFALLLAGCKLPASQAPETPDTQAMTTPIRIHDDTNEFFITQTAIAKEIQTDPQEPGEDINGEDPVAVPTDTPVPQPTVVVPTVTRPAEYTLREGEFPYCIARRFNLNPQDLLSLNNLGPNDLLSPGTTIQIPQTGTWEGAGRVRNPHPTTHTVAAGETIYSIACFYGDVSPEAIIAVNNLQEPYTLSPGQTLDIP